MIINNNAIIMTNAQVARGNNYSLEDKHCTDKKE